MDNSSYRSQYIEAITSDMAEQSATALENYWLRVAKYERKLGKYLEAGYTKEDYIELLNLLSVTNANTFYNNKSRLGSYLKWLVSQGLLSQQFVDVFSDVKFSEMCPDRTYDTKYFADFDSLQDAIETTLFAAERIDDAVFQLQISAIYLAWCGLTIEEALNIKKADILEDSIIIEDRVIYPEPKIIEYLVAYRDATEYATQGKGIIVRKYPHSDYLIRTAGSHHIESPRIMRNYIRIFGLSGGEENIYNYDKIYWSGIFNRAYHFECENEKLSVSNLPVLESIFQEKYPSSPAAYKRLLEYQKFRDYFYPTNK